MLPYFLDVDYFPYANPRQKLIPIRKTKIKHLVLHLLDHTHIVPGQAVDTTPLG